MGETSQGVDTAGFDVDDGTGLEGTCEQAPRKCSQHEGLGTSHKSVQCGQSMVYSQRAPHVKRGCMNAVDRLAVSSAKCDKVEQVEGTPKRMMYRKFFDL